MKTNENIARELMDIRAELEKKIQFNDSRVPFLASAILIAAKIVAGKL